MCNKAISFFILILFMAFSVLPINLSHADKRSQGISPRDVVASDSIPSCEVQTTGRSFGLNDTVIINSGGYERQLRFYAKAENCKGFPAGVAWNVCTFVDPIDPAVPSGPANDGTYYMVNGSSSDATMDYRLTYFDVVTYNDEWPTTITGGTGKNTFALPSDNPTTVDADIVWRVGAVGGFDNLQENLKNLKFQPGLYKASFHVTSFLVRAAENPVGGTCSPSTTPSSKIQDAVFTVSVLVEDTCIIKSVSDLDFGETYALKSVKKSTAKLTINCNSLPRKDPLTYNLQFDGGQNKLDSSTRQMKLKDGRQYIPYKLFLNNDGAITDIIVDQSMKFDRHPGSKDYTIMGVVPAQPGKRLAPGTYTDVVVITLSF